MDAGIDPWFGAWDPCENPGLQSNDWNLYHGLSPLSRSESKILVFDRAAPVMKVKQALLTGGSKHDSRHGSHMPRHPTSDAHVRINKIYTV